MTMADTGYTKLIKIIGITTENNRVSRFSPK